MEKKKTILIIMMLCCVSLLYSQDNAISDAINNNLQVEKEEDISSNQSEKNMTSLCKGWTVGFTYGLTQFDGDVRQYDHYPAYQETGAFSELQSAVSLSVNKKINSFYSITAEILTGSFAGLRRANEYSGYIIQDPYQNYIGDGDKFVASFKEVDLIVNVDLGNTMSYFVKDRKKNKLSFAGKLGMGYNIYNTVRRNLFSDTYIYSFGYEDEGISLADSDYGTIKTETLSSPSATVYIYGLIAKYKLNNRLDLVLDYTVRNGKTDKWDASIMSTQNTRDKFAFLSMGITYKLGDYDYNNEWESPIDGLKDDVGTLLVKIDGFTEDADNDGVADAFDKSKATPLGVAIDGSGKALDVDMDNVADYRDADPFSNRGAQVDVSGVELDDDKDGVPNSKDLESNTPIGAMVNQFGINLSNTTYINSGGVTYFPSIYFNSGSAIIVNSNANRIATIALLLKSNSSIKLRVIGHTDNVGSAKFNQQLGLKRANAVINYLILNYNIEAHRLIASTKGEEDPLSIVNQVTNSTETIEATNRLAKVNRRVDFEISY